MRTVNHTVFAALSAPFRPASMAPARRMVALAWLAALSAAGATSALAQAPAPQPEPARQQALLRMVRQDCGSCHGMRMTGGLGPALTPQALAERSPESVFATIYHGRPGTPMPPWRGLVSEAEARWIAERLRAGLPDGAGS